MNAARASTRAGSGPFSPGVALALVLFGAVVFVALLWMIGAGMMTGSTNNGGNHAGGKGLNGYAALAGFLERRGYDVRRSRSEATFAQPGLLVLTPPHSADGAEIARILGRHHARGPVLLVLPKWTAMRAPASLQASGAKPGWVMLGNPLSPPWGDRVAPLGPLDLRLDALSGQRAMWTGLSYSGRFPEPGAVQSLGSGRIVPLVRDGGGQTLAGRLDVSGYPVLVVAEPDLMNNYGFAERERAMLALAVIDVAMGHRRMPVVFDLTLNGLGRTANLLTLAFTPPFLAATLCLLLAAIAVGWRAFLRFGPPRKPVRAIAFGKRALVANTAGLIRRARRLHLIGAPYADHARDRLARLLALPRLADRRESDAAIDRALAARAPDATPFSVIAARLTAARNPHEIVRAARDLHALERTLNR